MRRLVFLYFLMVVFSLNVFATRADELLKAGNIALQSKNYKKAILLFKKAIKEDPKNYKAYLFLGNAYFNAKQYDLSIYAYQECIEINPDSFLAYNNIGLALKRKNYFENAILYLKKAIEKYKETNKSKDFLKYIYNNIGDTYIKMGEFYEDRKMKYFRKAISWYLMAIKIDRKFPYAYNDIGDMLNRLKKYDKAISLLKYATKLKPDYAVAYYNIGYAYYQKYLKGKNKKFLKLARKYFKKALKYDENLSVAKSALDITSEDFKEKQEKKIANDVKKQEMKLPDLMSKKMSQFTKEDILQMRLLMIKRINEDRAKYNLKPVKYDELASIVGDNHCKEELANNFMGHQSLDGYNPYHRYSLAGGNDYNAQNAAGIWGMAPKDRTFKELLKLMYRLHYLMVSEVPPNDGHRKNILDKWRTHVGIGLAFDNRALYMTQEFLNRYIKFESKIPRRVTLNDRIYIEARPYKGYKFSGLSVFYEKVPKPLTPQQINAIDHYSLPPTRDDLFKKLPPGWKYSDGSRGDVEVRSDGSFRSPVPFRHGKGIYTVVVWLMDENGHSFPASNISIWVR